MSIDYAAVLVDLEERRAKLTAAIDAIREIRASTPASITIHAATATATAEAQKPKVHATKKPRGNTVGSIAHELIRAHGGPMKVADIVKSLQGMGKFKTVDPRSNYGTVFGTLNDDHERFAKTGEGEFEIRERAAPSTAKVMAALEDSIATARAVRPGV